jgi:hypothetical protein
VKREELSVRDLARSREVSSPAQAAGDERVVDATILPAVERMAPFQAERRDVVTGVVDDGDHGSGPPSKSIDRTL